MVSCRGKPLTPEIKKLTVSAKQYFDRNKLTPAEPGVKRTDGRTIFNILVSIHLRRTIKVMQPP